jgi:membrane-associated phospholipid phosphatase
VFGTPAVMVAAGLLEHNPKLLHNGIELTAATLVNGVITVGLKRIIQRDRPAADPVLIEKSYSFPSGHTSSAFALATTLSLQYPKWYVIVPSYVYATLVGYSRIHLGVHYPSDVLGGMITGAGSAVLTKWVRKKLDTKKNSGSKTVLLY